SRLEAAQAVHPTQSRIQTGTQPLLGLENASRNRLAEGARIGDAIGDEGVDLVELAAGNLHADIVEFETQDTIVDHLHIVRLEEGERRLEIDARLGLHVDDLAEAQDNGLLALVDDKDGRIEQEENDARENRDEWKPVGHQFAPSTWFWLRFCNS